MLGELSEAMTKLGEGRGGFVESQCRSMCKQFEDGRVKRLNLEFARRTAMATGLFSGSVQKGVERENGSQACAMGEEEGSTRARCG